jgi:Ankyrin repeats (3 copies)
MLEVVKQLDSDGSGIIELEEFTEWWVQRSVKSRSGGGLIAMKLRKLARKAAQIFFTDIFTAVWNNDLNLVKTFLESDRRIGNASDVSEYGDGWMPLHYAAYKGHLSIAEELIEHSANVNATNDLGYSALFYACQQGHLEVCKLLLDRGGDPSICGNVTDSSNNFFMCPVDHCVDNKELLKLFKAHPSCAPPKQPPAEKMRAFITEGKALLSPLRSFSILPVKKWNIELNSPDSKDGFEIIVNGLDPNKWKNNSGNILEVLVDKKWVNSVYLPDGALPELTVKLSAVNSLGAASPFTDNIPVSKGDTLSRSASGVLPPMSVNLMAPLDAVDEDDDDDYNDNFEEKESDFVENDETIERLRREINGEESGLEDNGDDFEDELVVVTESPYK